MSDPRDKDGFLVSLDGYTVDIDRVMALMQVILASPDAWCQNKSAANANGESCRPTDALAKAWCINGARDLAIHLSEPKAAIEVGAVNYAKHRINERFLKANGGLSVAWWNDEPGRTHAEVMEALGKMYL